ncbi:MAG: YebC/PmpR family DNA-binding transcriptional regulator, partial [Chloroflexota bacterium]
TRLSREISVAAREGGQDPSMNPRLRLAIDKAKAENMPADTIKRAVEKGGPGDATLLQEITFEGYGPAGLAILIQTVTDNRNRTVAEVRNTLSRNGGSLGESGTVAWQFESKGLITVEPEGKDADELAMTAIDAGADDVQVEGEFVEIITGPTDLDKVRRALVDAGLKITSAELSMIPKIATPLDEKSGRQALRLIDIIEELEDVQKVYSNGDFPESVLLEYAAG